MPELPEVETVKEVLNTIIKNETIIKIDIYHENTIKNELNVFKFMCEGKTVLDVSRIGKYLLINLTDDTTIISHLRMEGKYILLNNDESIRKHTRVLFTFASGKRLSYDDSRMFGILKSIKTSQINLEKMLTKLAPEPFDLKPIDLYNRIKKLNVPIKSVLLDQTIIAGLGNIYADEVLYACKLNPLTKANQMTMKDCESIVSSSIVILNKAIEFGGSTIKSYHASRDVDGKFQNEIMAYGKENTPCPVCSTDFHKIFVAGRGTTFCPNCQKINSGAVILGITGRVASGKSTVLNICQENGFETISADEIVKDLYQDPTVVEKISRIAHIPFNQGTIDRAVLLKIMLDNVSIKRRVEKYVHGLVEEKLLAFIKNSKAKFIAMEVPLLFESGLEYMCNLTLAVEVSEEQQIKNLINRQSQNIENTLKLNMSNEYDTYKSKLNYIIKSNGNIVDLASKTLTIINEIKKLR